MVTFGDSLLRLLSMEHELPAHHRRDTPQIARDMPEMRRRSRGDRAEIGERPVGDPHAHRRASASSAFDKLLSDLVGELKAATEGAERTIGESFEATVAPQLQAGASAAGRDALATAQRWGQSVNAGGLHWATYKVRAYLGRISAVFRPRLGHISRVSRAYLAQATVRRGGVFRMNMNESLVEPVLKVIHSVSYHRMIA